MYRRKLDGLFLYAKKMGMAENEIGEEERVCG
jgi:hypothetical protein